VGRIEWEEMGQTDPLQTCSRTIIPKILAVDDHPLNLELIQIKLERAGMRVSTAISGEEALIMIPDENPDLILLDVGMPGMSGFEVCQQLKAQPETQAIPIIFITGNTSREEKLKGLDFGAVDYIAKPIDLDEMQARVQTQLRVVFTNREMAELQDRLAEARRSAVLGSVAEGIAHNLKNLVGIVSGQVGIIRAASDCPEIVQGCVHHAEEALHRLETIINQLDAVLNENQPPIATVHLQQALEFGVARFRTDFMKSNPIHIENPVGNLPLESNMEILEEILTKLLINAWEAYGKESDSECPTRITTSLLASPQGNFVEIRIEDEGRGIPAALEDSLFEPFTSTKRTVGVGMGLTTARHAARGLGGEISLENRKQGGACATIRHPIQIHLDGIGF